MDSHQYQALMRLFPDGRLHPWEPEHAAFIAGKLAELKVTDAHDYENFKKLYDQKMADYEATPDDPIEVQSAVARETTFNALPLPLQVEPVAEVAAPVEAEPAPKKGRPKKVL